MVCKSSAPNRTTVHSTHSFPFQYQRHPIGRNVFHITGDQIHHKPGKRAINEVQCEAQFLAAAASIFPFEFALLGRALRGSKQFEQTMRRKNEIRGSQFSSQTGINCNRRALDCVALPDGIGIAIFRRVSAWFGMKSRI
jgi:hypothetical protein